MTASISSAHAGADAALRAQLVVHHVVLERECRELLAGAYSDDPRALCARFRAFERAVLDHMEAEEVEILPSYSTYAASDARAVRHEHATIRNLLSTIGIDVELHQIRAATLVRLIDLLHAHAAHEDSEMYPWAEDHLAPSTHRALASRVARAMRSFASAGGSR